MAARAARAQARSHDWLLLYGALVILAEATLVVLSVPVGAALHAAVLIGAASHYVFSGVPKDRRLPVVALLPMLRLISFVMPITVLAPPVWYALSGAPALLATILTSRAVNLSGADLGLGMPRVPWLQLPVAATGVPIGYGLRELGIPVLFAGDSSPVLVAAIMVLFVVLLEELLFRGVVLRAARRRSPAFAPLLATALYMAFYFGSGSGLVVLAMGGIGLTFSLIVTRTGSLWGVIGAHAIFRLVAGN